MRVSGYRPRNAWLRRQLDGSWRRWLTWCVLAAAGASVALACFVGPRQNALRLRYRIARVKDEVERESQHQRRLLLERERLTSPYTLTAELGELGLAEVPTDHRVYLTAAGTLVTAAANPPGRTGSAGAAAR